MRNTFDRAKGSRVDERAIRWAGVASIVAAGLRVAAAVYSSVGLSRFVTRWLVSANVPVWGYAIQAATGSLLTLLGLLLGVSVPFALWRAVRPGPGACALGGWFAIDLFGLILAVATAVGFALLRLAPAVVREPLFWGALLLPLALGLGVQVCRFVGLTRSWLTPAWVPSISIANWALGALTLWLFVPSQRAFALDQPSPQIAQASALAAARLLPVTLAGAALSAAFSIALGVVLLRRSSAASGPMPA
jgi:hypothetical protein